MTTYQLTHLDALESEAIHIIREVVAEFERPALLFSGGKDSAVLLHLAAKACWPQPVPFPVVHVDTGHNFPEVIDVPRPDGRASSASGSSSPRCKRRSTAARSSRTPSPGATRNRLQTHSLLKVIEEHRFDAVFGGGRRDEEKARAKERVFSFRDEFGQWDPRGAAARAVEPLQRPAPARRALPGLPALELDRARHLAVHRARAARAAVDLLRPQPRGLPPRRDAARRRARTRRPARAPPTRSRSWPPSATARSAT